MKTYKKQYSALLLFFFFTLSIFSQSDDLLYHETSNILVSEKKSNVLDLGINYIFGYKEFQAIYNINKQFLAFGSYNFNTSTEERSGFFGDKITQENNNSGYSLGLGIKNFGEIGDYETLEVLVGYEFQEAITGSYFTNSNYFQKKELLAQKYYKFFTQFNMIENGNRHLSAISLKISYFKFLQNPIYNGATNLFFTPSYSYNYKLLSNKSLILTSQIGISVPIKSFESYFYSADGNLFGGQSNYVVGAILKFGIQYKINLKSNKVGVKQVL